MIAIFLDIDGVLNQYNINERKRRTRTKGFDRAFDPFKKKVLRLAKLVKKYDIHIYIYSAWTQEDLEVFLPFKIYGDTYKQIERVNEISKNYDYNILIDDEITHIQDLGLLKSRVILYGVNYQYGLIKDDFIRLNNIINTIRKNKEKE